MMIWRYKPPGTSNYGDALNEYLWPKLLHPRFNILPGTFYGIGTVLGIRMPQNGPHTVFGAGAGYSGFPQPDDSWKVYFVRGPHTSAVLGGVPHITDPALLLRKFHAPGGYNKYECSYMPRWDATSQELFEACDKAGIHIIDPRWSVPQVITHIQDTKLLLTETLHGAVTADALRIPWVSIYASRGHEFKWKDWTASMNMVWNPIDAAEFTLSWARDNAVPQLSAESTLSKRIKQLDDALSAFNYDIEAYIP